MKSKKLSKPYEIIYIPLDKVVDGPNQPRSVHNEDSIRELAKSIESEGLLQPPAVRLVGKDSFEVVYGSRRVRAFRELGRKEIPVIIVKEKDSEILSLLENVQREDLLLPDEARAFKRLTDSRDLSQTELAEKIGKHKSYVSKMVKLAGHLDRFRGTVSWTKLPRSIYLELVDAPQFWVMAEDEGWSQKKARAILQKLGRTKKRPVSETCRRKSRSDKPTESDASSLIAIIEDPAEWEPVEYNDSQFMICPFRFRKNSKVDIDLLLEKLSELQNKVDHIMTTLREHQGKAEVVAIDDHMDSLFQSKIV